LAKTTAKSQVSVELVLKDQFSKEFAQAARLVKKEAAAMEKAAKGLSSEFRSVRKEVASFQRTAPQMGRLSTELQKVGRSSTNLSKDLREARKEAERLSRVKVSPLPGGGRPGGSGGRGGGGGSTLGAAALGGLAGGAASLALGAGAAVFQEARDAVLGLASSLVTTAGTAQKFAIQLETVWGSTTKAKEAYQELSDFAARTPFELDGLVQTQVVLANLTNKTNAAVSDLTRLGDAASITGQPIQELAVHYGRIIEGLKNSRPIGESAQRLNELGVLSGQTRGQLEALIESGTGPKGLPLFLAEFEKFSGAMDKLSRTIPGLASTISDNFAQFQRDIAAGGVEEGLTDTLAAVVGFFGDHKAEFEEAAASLGTALGGPLEELAASIEDGELRTAFEDFLAFLNEPATRETLVFFFDSMVTGAETAAKALRTLAGVARDTMGGIQAITQAVALGSFRMNYGVSADQFVGGKQGSRTGIQAVSSGDAGALNEVVSKFRDLADAFRGSEGPSKALAREIGKIIAVEGTRVGGLDLDPLLQELRQIRDGLVKSAGGTLPGLPTFQRVPQLAGPVGGSSGSNVETKQEKKSREDAEDFARKSREFADQSAQELLDANAELLRDVTNLLQEADQEWLRRQGELQKRSGENSARSQELKASVAEARAGELAEAGGPSDAVSALRDQQIEAERAAQELRLEMARAAELAELEQLQASEEQKQQVRDYYRDQALANDEAASRKRKELAVADTRTQKQNWNEQLGGLQTFYGGVADLAALGAKESKEMRAVYKTAAIAEATIATYLAATKAFAEVPFPANIAAAAGITLSGLANVARIKEQKFATGGIVGGQAGFYGTGDTEAARLTRGEMVLTASQQTRLFQMADGKGGGSSGPSIVYSPQIPGGMAPAALEKVLLEDKERFTRVVRELNLLGASYGNR